MADAARASLKPEPWKANPECPEQNLISFQKYTKRFLKWLNITGMTGQRNDIIWDMLCMAGGKQMRTYFCTEARCRCSTRPKCKLIPGQYHQWRDGTRYRRTHGRWDTEK